MITPAKLDKLPEPMVKLMSELQDDIIKDICRRVTKANMLTPTAEWQLYKANQLRLSSAEVNKRIAQQLKTRERTVRELYTDTVKGAIHEDADIYRYAIAEGKLPDSCGNKLSSFTRSLAFSNVLKQGLKNTNGLMRNLTGSLAGVANRQFSDALDLAYLKVASGAFTPAQAIFEAVQKLGADGIKTVSYESGRTDQVDVAVRRAVLTGINKTCCDIQLSLAQEMECELVEVSSHFGARPTHAEWQGQIYSLKKGNPKYPYFYDATGYGRGDGLGGWNCRHSFFPFFDGISEAANAPDFSKAENLQEYNESQQQRAYERNIRKSKRELAALDSSRNATKDAELKAKLDRAFEKKSVTLKNREAKLAEFCKSTGHLPDGSRVRVDGFGRSVSQKAVWANKKLSRTASIRSGDVLLNAQPISPIIDSLQYYSRFKGITNNAIVNAKIALYAKKAIKNNAGTLNEDIFLLDAKTGKMLDHIKAGERGAYGVIFNLDINSCADDSIILIHNHSNNVSLGVDDISTLNRFPEIKSIIAAANNGKVFSLEIGSGKRISYRNSNALLSFENELNREFMNVTTVNQTYNAVKNLSNKYNWRYLVNGKKRT